MAAILGPYEVVGNMDTISGSLGISLYLQDGEAGDDMLRKADLAIYAVKNGGKQGNAYYG